MTLAIGRVGTVYVHTETLLAVDDVSNTVMNRLIADRTSLSETHLVCTPFHSDGANIEAERICQVYEPPQDSTESPCVVCFPFVVGFPACKPLVKFVLQLSLVLPYKSSHHSSSMAARSVRAMPLFHVVFFLSVAFLCARVTALASTDTITWGSDNTRAGYQNNHN